MLFALNIAAIALIQAARAETYERGDSGSTVREIQTLLKDWGYYEGSVDGIYGSATEAAVRLFQEKNGLTVDGRTRARHTGGAGAACERLHARRGRLGRAGAPGAAHLG